jgi:hypothetical protein
MEFKDRFNDLYLLIKLILIPFKRVEYDTKYEKICLDPNVCLDNPLWFLLMSSDILYHNLQTFRRQ